MKFPIYGNIKHVPNHQPNIIDWPLIDLDWCWSSYWPKGPDISILISPVARCDQRLRPSWMLTPNMIWKTRRIHLEKHEKSMAKSMPWKEQPKEPASFGCSQWWVLIQHSIGQFVQKAPQHNDGQVTSLKLACGHPTLKLGICKNNGILVGGWPTPLKNMSSSVGMMKFPIYGKIKARFQTTNQH